MRWTCRGRSSCDSTLERDLRLRFAQQRVEAESMELMYHAQGAKEAREYAVVCNLHWQLVEEEGKVEDAEKDAGNG